VLASLGGIAEIARETFGLDGRGPGSPASPRRPANPTGPTVAPTTA
jgi:hypothetical protein